MSSFPNLAELLPHSAPMILIDEVLGADEGGIVTRVALGPTSPFVEGNRIPAIIALEYMAQSIAAYAGLRARAAGEPVRIGYLLGTRELDLQVASFRVGDELRIEARHVWGDEQLGSFQCAVLREGRTVASALVNVYQGSEVPSP